MGVDPCPALHNFVVFCLLDLEKGQFLIHKVLELFFLPLFVLLVENKRLVNQVLQKAHVHPQRHALSSLKVILIQRLLYAESIGLIDPILVLLPSEFHHFPENKLVVLDSLLQAKNQPQIRKFTHSQSV